MKPKINWGVLAAYVLILASSATSMLVLVYGIIGAVRLVAATLIRYFFG